MKKTTLTKPRVNKISAGNDEFDLPHKPDQIPNNYPNKTHPIMRQSYDEFQRGFVDTDMHGTRGVEELLKNSVNITIKKRRSINRIK